MLEHWRISKNHLESLAILRNRDALANPSQYLQGAAGYVWYDLGAWAHDGVPTTVLRLTAEQLLHDGAGGGGPGGGAAGLSGR